MGFYNVNNGDVPYFKLLADKYALGDNYHQPVKGGTGADSVVLGFATLPYYTAPLGSKFADSADYPNGLTWKHAIPPSNQIENPNPQPGTNNWYTQDGYGGGTYSNCSAEKEPGVGPILAYMSELPYKPSCCLFSRPILSAEQLQSRLQRDGTKKRRSGRRFTIPPQSIPSIANTSTRRGVVGLLRRGLEHSAANPARPSLLQHLQPVSLSAYVMENPTRSTHLKDTPDLYSRHRARHAAGGVVREAGRLNDGHPSSSKFDIFEAFTKKIMTDAASQPALWATPR